MKATKIITLLILTTLLSHAYGGCGYTDYQNGFTSLFDGKTLDGWDLKIRANDDALAQKVFAVENGEIHVFKDLKNGRELNTGKNDTHGMIYSQKVYSKYIFKFEYKWGSKRFNNFSSFQYDAGMYYHVIDDSIWPKGIEYQVRFDHTKNQNHTGDFWASGTRFQWYSEDGKSFQFPDKGGKAAPQRKGEHLALQHAQAHNLDDHWNKCEVIVMGNTYTIHKLNGAIVNMATDLSVSEGLIGLQAETAEIFYRNITIKEFDEEIPMEHFLK